MFARRNRLKPLGHTFVIGKRTQWDSNPRFHAENVVQHSVGLSQNDQRSYVSEDLRRSTTELRRNDLHQSRAGGTRTHDIRRLMLYSNSAVDRCLQVFLSQRKVTNAARRCPESNPQGLSCKLGRLPTGSRRHSVCPSVMCFSSSTRNRSWNFSLEARDDVRFTIEPYHL